MTAPSPRVRTFPFPLSTSLLLLACCAIVALAIIPMDSIGQITAAAVLLGIMGLTHREGVGRPGSFFHVATLVIGTLITLRYVIWRGMYTLSATDHISQALTITLFLAELYSLTLHLLGCLVNASPLDRPLLSLADLPDSAVLPSVDVLVPSYNEDAAMLEVTLRAALMMRYPGGRLRVYLLDDGGTDQKVGDADPVKAAAAGRRRATLQALCVRLGAGYITRERNERAKAGNVNNALRQTSGDLVVVLDADHVPALDFLDHTVPWFVLHDDVFLVQTPHFMVNPDPIERNLLRSFHRMPSENDMFYKTIQKGLDFWASSFFCGSAAVLRRRHLDEIGGLQGDSITEDAESALELHRKGYRSIYVDRPMVAGLAPETFTGFVTQRMRWAQGMTQILLLKKPFLHPGLTWYQRVSYMSSLLFWLFPFARLIFLTAPLAYLLFGLEVYNASIGEIIAYTLPHIMASYAVANLLFGRTRWPLVSELYEIMQSLFSLRAVIQVFVNPRKPKFLVTPKGDTVEEEFISPLSRPFYILFWLILVGLVGGIYRFHVYPLTRDLTTVVLIWNIFNFVIILAALGALMERRERRATPRIPVQEEARLQLAEGELVSCEMDDVSAGGARILLDDGRMGPAKGDEVRLSIPIPSFGGEISVPCRVRATYRVAGRQAVGLAFDKTSEQAANAAVALAFGDSARWTFFQDRRFRPIPFSTAAGMILRLMWVPVIGHVGLLIAQLRHFRRPAGAFPPISTKKFPEAHSNG
jgi:cellulose synthase (UDP-forming)